MTGLIKSIGLICGWGLVSSVVAVAQTNVVESDVFTLDTSLIQDAIESGLFELDTRFARVGSSVVESDFFVLDTRLGLSGTSVLESDVFELDTRFARAGSSVVESDFFALDTRLGLSGTAVLESDVFELDTRFARAGSSVVESDFFVLDTRLGLSGTAVLESDVFELDTRFARVGSSVVESDFFVLDTRSASVLIPMHILRAGAVGAGTILPSGLVFVPSYTNQLFTFSPDAWHRVADVVVDGISLGTLPSYNWENVQAPGTITVWFAENLITNNTPVPVPEAWMAQYGLTNDMASLVNVYHPEFGATTWQIYVMDANPTSGVGVLRLNLEQSNVTQRIGWYVSSNRVYSLFGSTNLNAGITNLLYGPFQPPQSGVWVYDDSDDAGRGFYRVRVELP